MTLYSSQTVAGVWRRKLSVKWKTPLVQRINHENAERMIIASVVTEHTGVLGHQVRYANPRTLEQVQQIALSVQEAETQERFSESFYAKFDRSVRLTSKSPSRTYSEDEEPRRSDSREVNSPRN